MTDPNIRKLIRWASLATKDMKPRRAERDTDIRDRLHLIVVTGHLPDHPGEEMISQWACDYGPGGFLYIRQWDGSLMLIGAIDDLP